MQWTYKPVILFLFLILAGCAIKHDYVWHEYAIAPERISSQNSFKEGREIRIIKGKSNDSRIVLGSVGFHRYYGSEQALTDAIVDQLSKELLNKRLEIKNTAEKSLEITANRSKFELGMSMMAATIEFTVKFGSGKAKSYTVRNSTQAMFHAFADRAYNGAVALAVIKIMNDPEVLTYINE